MVWQSWSEFFAMGGRGFFVWGSFGVSLLLIVAELYWLRAARCASLCRLRQLQQLEADEGGRISLRAEPTACGNGLADAPKA
jgi:heme exporter protein D